MGHGDFQIGGSITLMSMGGLAVAIGLAPRRRGAGAELQKPLALAVIGGLAPSTPVTLLVVPGLYTAIRLRRLANSPG